MRSLGRDEGVVFCHILLSGMCEWDFSSINHGNQKWCIGSACMLSEEFNSFKFILS